MNAQERQSQIISHLGLGKQIPASESDAMTEIRGLAENLSPIAKQKLAIWLLSQVTEEAL
jgi:hypothetical protein